jgi:hypothetical protein
MNVMDMMVNVCRLTSSVVEIVIVIASMDNVHVLTPHLVWMHIISVQATSFFQTDLTLIIHVVVRVSVGWMYVAQAQDVDIDN